MYLIQTVLFSLLIQLALTITVKQQSHSYSYSRQKLQQAAAKEEYLHWVSKRYHTFSYTLSGELCMDNCVQGNCITDWSAKKKPCKVGTKAAPVYFTSKTQDKSFCLSKCGYFGYSYEWCFVDEKYNWDYCSSTNYKKEIVHVTADGNNSDRCVLPCEYNSDLEKSICVDIWGDRKTCDRDNTLEFVHAKTIYGIPCASPCERYKPDVHTMSYYTCYDVERNANQYCSPPARMVKYSKLEELYKELYTIRY